MNHGVFGRAPGRGLWLALAVTVLAGTSCAKERSGAAAERTSAPPPAGTSSGGDALGTAAAAITIAAENALPGIRWGLVAPARPGQLEGYASAPSVNHGEPIALHLRADGTHQVSWELLRMGWYGGLGARLVARGGPVTVGPQPSPSPDPSTGRVECRWPVSFTIPTDPAWTSGVYLVRLTRDDGPQSYVISVVRADERKGAAVVQASVTTWQAYNDWGGESLYVSASGQWGGYAKEVSFDRPYANDYGAGEFLDYELPFVLWAESRGYDLTYVTNVDVDRDPSLLQGQRLFVSVGHDEYWSRPARAAVESAIGAGVNVAFLSADTCYWQIRLEASSAGTPRRTEVCYKAASLDPLGTTSLATVRWRDPPLNDPENALRGVMSDRWQFDNFPFVVAHADSWVYAGTGVQEGDALSPVVGYETDRVFDNGHTPAGLVPLARSPYLQMDAGPNWHNASVYPAPSGAFVFTAGSIEWSWGLSGGPGAAALADARIQRMTDNLFQRAGLSPALAGDDFGAATPRPVDTSVSAGSVTLLAGSPFVEGLVDGPAAQARFRRPLSAAVDAAGNVFVVDTGNHSVRMLAADSQRTVTRIAGTGAPGRGEGPGAGAALNTPQGIAVGPDGSLFVADGNNNRVVRIARDSAWTVSTWAGSTSGAAGWTDGSGTAARFDHPAGVAAVGSDLFVTDSFTSKVRRIDAARNVTTVVGAGGRGWHDGSGATARLNRPTGIVSGGGALWLVDTANRAIRRIALDGTYTTTTVTGQWPGGFGDGPTSSALLMPQGGGVYAGGALFVADSGNGRVRRVAGGQVGTYAGGGNGGEGVPGSAARLWVPTGIVALADGSFVVVDEGDSTLRLLSSGSGGSTPQPVATPTFSPAPGTYASPLSVTLSDATPSAAIYYTTDGSTPTTSSTLYSAPIAVSVTTTIKAIAAASGLANSVVATGAYTIQPSGGGATTVDFGAGFTATGLQRNGSAALSGTRLRLTNGGLHQAASAFFTTPVSVQSFTSDFSFQLTSPGADGITFTLQGIGPTALGPDGGGLGYGPDSRSGSPGIGRSVAVKFDLYNNAGEGTNSTGLYVNGASPTVPAVSLSGVNLHSGDVFNVHVTYDGANLAMTIADASTGATASVTFPIDIPATVGSTTAYAGFTAGTGGLTAIQDILSWTYASASGSPAPPDFTISASPSSVTASGGGSTASTITVTAQSGFSGTVSLSAAGVPSGATASFDPTSVTGSGSSTLTLSAGSAAAGTYTVTVTGTAGSLVHSTNVAWTLSTVAPPPASGLVFSDDFNRTTGLGTSWTVPYGSFTTDGSYAVSGTPLRYGNWAAVVPATGTNDYSVAADLIVPPGSLYSGIFARADVAGAFDELYAAQLSTNGTVNLYRRNAWSWTQLGSVAAGIVAGTRYRLELVATGSSPVHLEVWLDGARRISYDDSSSSRITGGAPGIENYDGGVKCDAFDVYAR